MTGGSCVTEVEGAVQVTFTPSAAAVATTSFGGAATGNGTSVAMFEISLFAVFPMVTSA
jgi:hypothetical protein